MTKTEQEGEFIMAGSPYALGFSTLEAELRVDALPVRGETPVWLRGVLLRTGPAKFEIGDEKYNHWFDGLAMLHRFEFSDRRVGYANRFLRSRAYQEGIERGKIMRREFATDPHWTFFERVAAFFSPAFTDNCNVNIGKFDGDFVALTEVPPPIRFRPDTLETLGAYDYGDDLGGHVSIAHPHFDFQRMRQYSFVVEFGLESRYRLYSVAAGARRRTPLASIAVREPAYMHSFGMTERYLVLTEFPLVVNPIRLRFSGRPFIRNHRWKPERGVVFHVVDKETGRSVKTAQGPSLFGFHHVNAFERDGEIAVDVVTYPDAAIIERLRLDALRTVRREQTAIAGQLTRFWIDLGEKKDVRCETLCETSFDLPRIDYRSRSGRSYRYVYGVGAEFPDAFSNELVKIDLEKNQTVSWSEQGCYPGEPVFAPAPNALREDDGVVLSVVLDAERKSSFLLILDASSYAELARAEAPHHIPFGFHGDYFAKT
jgi:beta,beta-carotene 9',10'-dioxygenase